MATAQSSGPPPAPRVADGRTPLWRAHNVYRVVTLLYAGVWVVLLYPEYRRPWLAAVVYALMVVWTAYTVRRYVHRTGRTKRLVLTDQVVVTVLFLASEFVLTEQQMATGLPSVVTTWQPVMVITAAIQFGVYAGAASGLVSAAANFLLRGYLAPDIWMDTLLLVGVGLVLGLAADTARRSTERLARALRAEAATAERERLARSIHDSVLQVLARVRHRGAELGGEAAELATLAGEQEIALRALIATTEHESTSDGDADLAGRLHALRTARIEVSTPGGPVRLPEPMCSELVSLAREALANVARHAGESARAWVFLEELPDEVALTIRDDGPGIPQGRLDQAAEEGRMGVAQSIRGRAAAMGGTVELDTAPGEGTEWEVRVPRPAGCREGGGRR
ncbi:MacS family sensor histidine kinase [Saccharopolyspora sp. CA-218241]|uniref:MacS family sensor histidine kinase n=1 Tax=Saccharopolyspora sp. CA-218241 TaxID=3240027 RepID=UPI003D9683A5